MEDLHREKLKSILCYWFGPGPINEREIRIQLSQIGDEDAQRLSSRTITKGEMIPIVAKICAELGHPIPGGRVAKCLEKLGPLCCCKKSRLTRDWDYS